MATMFRVNSRAVSYAEYWRLSRSWAVVRPWMAKTLRLRLDFGAVPVLTPHADHEVAAEKVDPGVLAETADKRDALAALGFVGPLWIRGSAPDGRLVEHAASYRHPSEPITAHVVHVVASGTRTVSAGLASVRGDGEGGTFTHDGPHLFDAVPGVVTQALHGASAAELLDRHRGAMPAAEACLPVGDDDQLRSAIDTRERWLLERNVASGRWLLDEDEVPSSPDEDPMLRLLAEQGKPKRNWRGLLLVAGLSLTLFVALGALRWNWKFVVILAGVLAFHEAGHFVFMRAFGYRNLKMFFIPFLGAAVTGVKSNVPAWKKAVVALAGPVPGIVAAFALLLAFPGDAAARLVALVSFFLNGINLLPVLPLDGGHVAQELVFRRHPAAETAFRILAIAACTTAAVAGKGLIFGLLAAVMLATLAPALRRAWLAHRIRSEHLVPVSDAEAIPSESLLVLKERLGRTRKGPVNPVDEYHEIVDVWERINARPPRVAVTGLFLAVHVGAFAAACGGAAMIWSAPAEAWSSPAVAIETWESVGAPRHDAGTRTVHVILADESAARAAVAAWAPALGEQEALVRLGPIVLVTSSAEGAENWRERLSAHGEAGLFEDGKGGMMIEADASPQQCRELDLEMGFFWEESLPPWLATEEQLAARRLVEGALRRSAEAELPGDVGTAAGDGAGDVAVATPAAVEAARGDGPAERVAALLRRRDALVADDPEGEAKQELAAVDLEIGALTGRLASIAEDDPRRSLVPSLTFGSCAGGQLSVSALGASPAALGPAMLDWLRSRGASAIRIDVHPRADVPE